jgi:aminoglycoside phosphotransferase (APT) family kinase protein
MRSARSSCRSHDDKRFEWNSYFPVNDEDIGRSLLDYLRSTTACPVLAFAEAPARMSGGYDAAILRFSLQSAPDPFSGPLVLRLFQATADAQRAPREAAVQNALTELGYPAPHVFIAEPRVEPLGAPFLIMERMPGRSLGSNFEGLSVKGVRQTLDILRRLPRIRREVLRLWDEAQTRLHTLPVSDFVDRVERAGFSGETFTVKSYFMSLRASAEELRLYQLRPAIDWLNVHRPRGSQTPVICHGDFQPLNVLADRGRLTGVIDWVKTTIADPAFDYGAVLAILATVPISVPAGLHRTLRALMNNLARAHSRRYRSLPESAAALAYYQVFNCVVQLVTVGRSRAQGGTTLGVYNSPVGVANLINHVHLLTGLKVSMPT